MYIVDNVFTYISCFGSVCVYEKESDELVTSLCDKLYSVLPNMILCRHLWPTILVAISAHTYVVDNFFTSNPLSFRKFWIILEQCVSVRRNLMSHQSWTCDKHVWQTVTIATLFIPDDPVQWRRLPKGWNGLAGMQSYKGSWVLIICNFYQIVQFQKCTR